jgi:hypothetical protein
MAGAAIRRFWHSRPELDAGGARHRPDRGCTFVLVEQIGRAPPIQRLAEWSL